MVKSKRKKIENQEEGMLRIERRILRRKSRGEETYKSMGKEREENTEERKIKLNPVNDKSGSFWLTAWDDVKPLLPSQQ